MRKSSRIIAALAILVMATATISAYAAENQPQTKSDLVTKESKKIHSSTAVPST